MGRFLATLVLFGAAMVPLRGATIVAEFSLRGGLDDNLGGPAFTSLGGQIQSTGYIFAANQGLTLLHPLFDPASYSIELSFALDETSGYRKIIDFKDRSSDGGFYDLSGALNFYPVVTGQSGDFTAGTPIHVVLTRDGATAVVTGYVNGQQRFTFSDAGSAAVFTANAKVILFADDFATGQRESSSGTVNYVRFYNGALTASEVTNAYLSGPPAAIPEPSTAALLMIGLALLLWTGRYRLGRPLSRLSRGNTSASRASSLS